MRPRFQWAWLGLCLLPLLPGIVGPFVLDDLQNLQPVFTAIALGDWRDAVFGNASGFLGRPLAMASFAVNAWLFGDLPLTYKLFNILLHGVNGALVFSLSRTLLAALHPLRGEAWIRGTALLAAALWLLHPLQVSTVLYVVQRMAMLSATGILVALLIGARYLAGDRFEPARSFRTLALMAVASGIALLSKEIAILTPLLLGVIAWVMRAPAPAESRRQRRRFVIIACAVPIAILVGLAFAFRGAIASGYAIRDFTLSQRLATEPLVLLGYLRSMFWPDLRHMGISLAPTVHDLGDLPSVVAIALWACAFVAAFVLRRKWPVPGFALLWFLACHALESGVIGLELAFEHRNYLALFGPALLLADLCGAAWLRRRAVATGLVVLLLTALASLTAIRAWEWSDEHRLLQLEADRHPGSLRALNNLGEYYFRHGDADGMARTTQRMADRFPEDFFAQSQRLILIACHVLPGPPDWETARAAATHKLPDSWASTSLGSIANNLQAAACDGIDPRDFAAFTTGLLREYRSHGLHSSAADALVALARLRRNAGDATGYQSLLRQAVAEDPASHAAALELLRAYLADAKPRQAGILRERLRRTLKSGPELQELQRLQAVESPPANTPGTP